MSFKLQITGGRGEERARYCSRHGGFSGGFLYKLWDSDI